MNREQIILRTVDFLKKNLASPVTKHEFTLTNKNFMWLVNHNRLGEAIGEFRKVAGTNYRKRPRLSAILQRRDTRRCGSTPNAYTLLAANRKNDALQLFNLMVESYPASANAYDGLADGYEAMGNREQALKQTQACLALLDKDITIAPAIQGKDT